MNRQAYQPWPKKGMMLRGSEPTGMSVWIMTPGKPPSPAKWVVKKEENEFQPETMCSTVVFSNKTYLKC